MNSIVEESLRETRRESSETYSFPWEIHDKILYKKSYNMTNTV